MALPPLSAAWQDGPLPIPQQYAADMNNVELKVNENSDRIAILEAGGGGGPGPTPGAGVSRLVDFGFGQSEIGHETWYSTSDVRAILAGIKAAGATRVRFAAWWAAFEPTTRGVYDWDGLNRCFNLCEEYGLEPLVCIVGPGPAYSSPTFVDYANACGALAARYGAEGTGQAKHYEIWNEPNHRSFYAPFESSFGAAHYTTLLIQASNAIRAADSGAFIVSAGMMSTVDFAPNDILPSTFLQQMYNNGAQDYFDAFGFHWYSSEPDFTGWVEPSTTETFYSDLLECRDVMVAEGDSSKGIWVTEMGLPEPDIAATVRAEWMAQKIELLRVLDYVDTFYLYNYRCTDATLTGSNQYGAVTFGFVERQPYFDYVASINRLVKGTPEGSVTTAKLANNSVTLDKINATGTRNATTYLNGTGAFTVPPDVGGGGSAGADWNTNLTNIPTTFPPSTHTHAQSDVTGLSAALAGRYGPGGTDVALADGGTGTSLVDPNADRILFWDDSAGAMTWLTLGTNLAITGTTIDASGGGGGSVDAGYTVALGAMTADVPVTITHGLNTRYVNVVVQRTHLVGGLTGTEPGEIVGMKPKVTGPNTITLDPSVNCDANEFFCTVRSMSVTGDVTAPGTPTLSSTAQGSTTVSLSVTAASGSPAGYNWYRPAGGILIGTTAGTVFVDTGLTPSTAYSYTAKAFDLAGNESGASNTVNVSTVAGAPDVVLDTVGAGNRVTMTNTITATQVVNGGANKHMIAFVVISQDAWIEVGTANSDFSTMTLTSSLGVSGSPAVMTKLNTTYVGPAGQAGGTIHLYELDNPAIGTHILTLAGVPGSIAPAHQIMIFSGSYHNVASITNINSFRSTAAATVNQDVTSATGGLAVCCVVSDATAVAGFNKTLRDSDGSVLANHNRGDFGLYGEAAGATTVNFTTSNSEWHAFLGANLVKA